MIRPKKATRAISLLVSGLLLTGCGLFTDEEADPDTSDPEEMPADDNGAEDTDTDTDTDNGSEEETPDEDEGNEVAQDVESWFPMLEDTLLDYSGEGNEFAPFSRYPQFTHDNTLQMVESTAGTDIVTIYEYSDEEVREIFIRPETYFLEDFFDTELSSEQDDFEIILQLPLEVGHSWESPSGSTSEITGIDVEKSIPTGTVPTIEVTRTTDDDEMVYYYAEDIGLVERIFNPDDEEMRVTSTLSTISEDTPEEIPLTVYTVDSQANGLVPSQVTMELFTNDPARLEITDVLKDEVPEEDINRLIEENANINFMYLREDGVVHVDFTVELSSMNAGSGVESLILQGIVNTIGDYYQVDEVLLTLDGEPYESGHIVLEEEETLPVDHSNVN